MIEWIIGLSILALVAAAFLFKWMVSQPAGSPAMEEISSAIRQGAEAFLSRQYKTIAVIAVLLAILLYSLYSAFGRQDEALRTSIAFILGAVSSAIAGYIGMQVAIRANVRTAHAAGKSLDDALALSLRSGLIPGLCVVALSLLGISVLYMWFGADPAKTPHMLVGYGFGASLVALFAQLGGGIYTKAADVGADLVGKVEAGIPEDDPRNPAVIADLVGDNVGDCAGRGADLFESISAETIGAMILGVALASTLGPGGVLFPLLLAALCMIASIIGVWAVKTEEGGDPMAAMTRGFLLTAVLCAGALYLSVQWLLQGQMPFFYAGLVGILTSVAFVYITRYYTEYRYQPVRDIANASTTGPATVMIQGLSLGLECTAVPAVVISAALWGAYQLGASTGFAHGGLFGTALATMGMLSTAVYVLAMDNFGPITDNAGGIVEMSKGSPAVRKRTDKLDAAGNTTKALTKGYAVGSAALAAFLLFSAYLDQVSALTGKAFEVVNLARVEVFIGALLGATLVFLFSSFALRAVGRTAGVVIMEVRRQFKENKGIMKGTSKPDYARCVDIITQGALKSMVVPGLLVVLVPVIVGILLRAEAMAGFLMVSTITGILLALFMNNAGGAWDNAKKYIETGVLGGKKSDCHKAAVVGDTVGDPFKDTAGPSLHVLIKMLATITLVLAPLFI